MDEEVRQLIDQRASPGLRLTQSRLRGDHQVAQELWLEVREGPLPHGEGEHIGGSIDAPIPGVQTPDAGVIDHQHAEVTGLLVEGREQLPQDLFERPGVDRDDLLSVLAADGHWCFGSAV